MNAITTQPIANAAFYAERVLNKPELIEAYFTQTRGYAHDRLKSAVRGQMVAWTVAGCATIAAVAGCVAIAVMIPLKGTEVIVLRVDEATGMTDRVYDVEAGPMSASDAERRYWLWQYVLHREGYTYGERQHNFDVVNLMSTGDVQQEYNAAFRGSNLTSPQVTLGSTGRASIGWVSTTIIGPKQALLRYVVTETKDGNQKPAVHRVATIDFDFAHGSISGSALNINPRGFLVTSYHTDPEAPE